MAVALLSFVASAAAISSQGTDSSSVDVTVASQIGVQIDPASLSYSTVFPGSINKTSDKGLTSLEIENTGSENITRVWLSTSVPRDNPFGTGTSGSYDAGNFVVVRPTNEISGVAGSSVFKYVDRREYNESNTLSYIKTSAGGTTQRYGRFKVGNEEFFWEIEAGQAPGTSGAANPSICDGTGSSPKLLVGNKPHTGSNLGTADFRSSNSANYASYTINDLSTSDTFGVAKGVDLNVSSGNRTYDILTYCGDSSATAQSNETFTQRVSYDVKPGSSTENLGSGQIVPSDLAAVGTSSKYMLNSTGSTDQFKPGQHFSVKTGVQIPRGAAVGSVGTGSLDVFISTN